MDVIHRKSHDDELQNHRRHRKELREITPPDLCQIVGRIIVTIEAKIHTTALFYHDGMLQSKEAVEETPRQVSAGQLEM